MEARWKVERVVEKCTAPCMGKNQYLLCWRVYGRDEDEWIIFEDISLEIF